MADYQTINAGRAGAGYAAIDEGLRTHMNKVYGLMSVGMLLTGLVAWAVGTNEQMLQAIFTTPLKWVVMFAPLAVVFAFGAMLPRMSAATAQLVFYVYAALVGLSLSFIFAVFTGVSITQTFLVTAIAFAGLISLCRPARPLGGCSSFDVGVREGGRGHGETMDKCVLSGEKSGPSRRRSRAGSEK